MIRQTGGIAQALTLFALAHPIRREWRGGVIGDGGHGRSTIDIIRPNRPRFCIIRVTNTSHFKASWANFETIAEDKMRQTTKPRNKSVGKLRDCGIGSSGGDSRGCGEADYVKK